jgi:hypothetical protein
MTEGVLDCFQICFVTVCGDLYSFHKPTAIPAYRILILTQSVSRMTKCRRTAENNGELFTS